MKAIVVCDKPEYQQELLNITHLEPEIWNEMQVVFHTIQDDLGTLSCCDFLVFLINPNQIGRKAWLKAVESVNRRPASVLFLINEKECLGKKERQLVINELELALAKKFPGARVGLISTKMALFACNMRDGVNQVKDELLQRSITYYLNNQDLEELPDVKEIYKFSEISRFIDRLRSYIKNQQILREIDIDPQPDHPLCLLISTRDTGKTVLKGVLERTCPGWQFVEKRINLIDIQNDEMVAHADALLFVSDQNFLEDFKVIAPLINREKYWFVLNKRDDYIRYGTSELQVYQNCLEHAKKLNIPYQKILLTSAYYAQVYISLRSKEINLQQIIANPEIVLLDSLRLPLDKKIYQHKIVEWLSKSHGVDILIDSLGGSFNA